MKFRQIKETCLYVRDLERTRSFYTEKIGLEEISFVPGRHVFFRAGSSVLLCFNPEVTAVDEKLPPHYGRGHLHLAFECENAEYDSWMEKIKAAGIEISHEATWREGLRSFYFHDPDGHVLEIVEPGIWG